MAEGSLNIEGLRDKIGVEREVGVYEIEKGMIRKFALAIDDPNPLWQDEEYAKESKYGSIIAPPTFILTIGLDQIEQELTSLSSMTTLHGSTELECYQPVRPGDKITVTRRLDNIRERQGRGTDKIVFMTFEITYKNHRQELVAKCRQILIGL